MQRREKRLDNLGTEALMRQILCNHANHHLAGFFWAK